MGDIYSERNYDGLTYRGKSHDEDREGYDWTSDEEAFDEPRDQQYPDRHPSFDDEDYPLPGEYRRGYMDDDEDEEELVA